MKNDNTTRLKFYNQQEKLNSINSNTYKEVIIEVIIENI